MTKPADIQLNNGVTIPQLGFGTLARDTMDKIQPAVEIALETGYRFIDCAEAYNNEREVGRGLAASGLPREEYQIETKLWVTEYGFEETLRAFDKSAEKLGVDYIDVFLLHWPMPMKFEKTLASYKACERLVEEGRIRALGVSNFSAAHLDDLANNGGVLPVLNQIEIHPRFIQADMRSANARRGILTQAWSPLGLPVRREHGDLDPLKASELETIARAHGKTTAQVILRWHMQRGDMAIPKSVTPSRIRENFEIFDFALTDDEMSIVNSLDTGRRYGADPETTKEDTYPITVED